MLRNVVPESAAGQRKQFAAAYSVLQSAVQDHAFPGAAFGVLSQARILALDGVGHFTYEEEKSRRNPQPVAASTVYDLASITKVMATTAAAMLLYDRGILDLEEPVGDVLPGFVIGMEPGSGKNRVTMRMLLAHSSGLPGYAPLFETHSTPQQMLRACLRLPLIALPGTHSEYSDIGFIILGTALEVLSGQKLASLCAREIFEPLGMNSTRFCPLASLRTTIPPTEIDTTFRRRTVQGEVHDENCFALGGATGHAGVFSNAHDVLRFAGCILAGGKTPPAPTSDPDMRADPALRLQVPSVQLFRHPTVELFAARQDSPAGNSRALGWDTPTAPSSSGTLFSPGSIGHLGYTGTSLWIDRQRDLAVILLTNRTWPDRKRPPELRDAIQRVRPTFHDAVVRAL